MDIYLFLYLLSFVYSTVAQLTMATFRCLSSDGTIKGNITIKPGTDDKEAAWHCNHYVASCRDDEHGCTATHSQGLKVKDILELVSKVEHEEAKKMDAVKRKRRRRR